MYKSVTLVTNKGTKPIGPYLDFIKKYISAGVSHVQLREKSLSKDELLDFSTALKNMLDEYNIPLIINDHVDLCIKIDAAGVHVGQSDGDVVKIRSLLGNKKIIGLSVNNFKQIISSNSQPIDYIGVGAIFTTLNKLDIETIWGLNGLKQAYKMASHPIIAIGGINKNNALAVMQAGATGIAAIGLFHDDYNTPASIKNLVSTL